MKRPITLAVAILLLMLNFSSVKAQKTETDNKPALFAAFPDRINCTVSELSRAFATSVNQNVNLSFSDNFLFNGVVISNQVKYANLQTAVIRSAQFGDAIFVLSKIAETDGSFNYVGHIVNTKYTDGYDLKKNAAGNYELVKTETAKVLQDCHQN